MNPEQREAFLGASYGPARARFRLNAERRAGGMVCPASGCWVIVTAWNPGGVRTDQARNEEAHKKLLAELHAAPWPFEPVMNGEGDWQEPAYLVRGAPLQEALRWARTFGQAASLFGVGGRAALVWQGGQVERYWAVRA